MEDGIVSHFETRNLLCMRTDLARVIGEMSQYFIVSSPKIQGISIQTSSKQPINTASSEISPSG